MGKILAICTSPRRGTLKTPVPSAVLTPEWGIVGDAHGGSWHRQVSLLATESVEPMRAVLPELLAKIWWWKGSILPPCRCPAFLPLGMPCWK